MGREIRRVPPDWQHPRRECHHSPWAGGCDDAKQHGGMCYQPKYDRSFAEAATTWKADFAKWEAGERQSDCEFWEYCGNPPNPEYYRPEWTEQEATHYQIYSTVSEGTPRSPVFASLDELAAWLVAQGTSEEAAKAFAETGWCPSGMFANGKLATNYESLTM
jgi:hypothetical protein